MDHSYAFQRTSWLPAPAEQVWRHASSMVGVNRELAPLVRMTYPPDKTHLSAATVPLSRRAFRSWLLLFGVLPIDYDDLTFVALEPLGFTEQSSMGTNQVWRHRRRIVPDGHGCFVIDEVQFVPRFAVLGPLALPLFALAFRLRHRNLRRIFAQS